MLLRNVTNISNQEGGDYTLLILIGNLPYVFPGIFFLVGLFAILFPNNIFKKQGNKNAQNMGIFMAGIGILLFLIFIFG